MRKPHWQNIRCLLAGRMRLDLLDELRHLIQHQTQLAFLFAGVQTMAELGPDWSSYFINIKPIAMSYLQVDEARDLITNPDPGAAFSLTYTETVIDRIIDLTHCHPYLVQLVCSALVEEANAAQVTHVDPDLLEKGLLRALSQGEPYFHNVWLDMAGPAGRPLLQQIAAAPGPLSFNDLTAEAQQALVRMVKRRVLSQTAEGYMVEVPLVRRWVVDMAPED